MRTATQTLEEITWLTSNIQSNYPELYQYLEENPLTLPPQPNAPVDRYEDYLESLKSLLRNHITTHKMQKHILPDLAGTLEYSADRFQSKILSDQDGQKIILFAFAKGQGLKSHTTPKDALLIMLEGECSFEFPEEERAQTLKTGQIIQIPAHVPHAVHALTNFKMALIK
ncbi:cupin domain-containing protein [Rufibacter ruber]|uniref:cupin domain-containing protein n=1 Tax=Rufibacter ruber TaxID=1783499 RepID=UPI000A4AB564|nr:cupin domain-containing protein [Rufibacter ruber]